MNNLFEVGDKVKLKREINISDLEHFNNPIPYWTNNMINTLLAGFTINDIVVKVIITNIDNQRLIVPFSFLDKISSGGHPYTKIFK